MPMCRMYRSGDGSRLREEDRERYIEEWHKQEIVATLHNENVTHENMYIQSTLVVDTHLEYTL